MWPVKKGGIPELPVSACSNLPRISGSSLGSCAECYVDPSMRQRPSMNQNDKEKDVNADTFTKMLRKRKHERKFWRRGLFGEHICNTSIATNVDDS